MAQVLRFPRPQDPVFASQMATILSAAYDKALVDLQDRGQPEIVCEVLAQRIVALAEGGEHDPDKLAERALAAVGIFR